LRTNAGRVVWLENEQQFTPGPGSFGLCAPYLNLYLHFSLLENLAFFNRLRGSAYDPQWIEASGLKERQNESLHTYSSGMLQRARLLFAVAHTPRILLLDEPGSNLDDQGWTFVQLIVKRQRQSGGITILATNEERERQLGDAIYALA
jgi:ABC-type multidrug transport system ATPase subunit